MRVSVACSDARNKIRDEFKKHRDVQTKSEIEGVSIAENMPDGVIRPISLSAPLHCCRGREVFEAECCSSGSS